MIENKNAMQFKAILPDNHDLENIDVHFESFDPKDPVVVFLDPVVVLEGINEIEGCLFTPNPYRYPNLKDWINLGNFPLPLIQLTPDEGIVIAEGRHRTLAMVEMQIQSVPYLTARGMSQKLKLKAGRDPSKQFDLSTIHYPVV